MEMNHCDCCNAPAIKLGRHEMTGIETRACLVCERANDADELLEEIDELCLHSALPGVAAQIVKLAQQIIQAKAGVA